MYVTFQAMSYSVFIFKQANVPEDSIPYVIVAQGAINVLATIVAVSSHLPQYRLLENDKLCIFSLTIFKIGSC